MTMFIEIKVKFEYNQNKKLKLKREVVKKLSKLLSRNNKGLEYMNKTLRKQGREIKKSLIYVQVRLVLNQEQRCPPGDIFGCHNCQEVGVLCSWRLVAGSQGGC